MRSLVVCVVVTLALVLHVDGYSSGAPDSACGDMVPQHPVAAQSKPSPYTITTSTKVNIIPCISPSDECLTQPPPSIK